MSNRWGRFKGYVRDNSDPEARGRIRCYCPQVMGPGDTTDKWTGWAEEATPWLGGLSLSGGGPPLTNVQNGGKDLFGVWLEFEGGEEDFPIWTGTFTVAATPDVGNIDLSTTTGAVGGSLIQTPPAGSNYDAINPPKPAPDDQEIRIMAPSGKDIVFMSANGGSVVVGPNGVILTGIKVFANGRDLKASSDENQG